MFCHATKLQGENHQRLRLPRKEYKIITFADVAKKEWNYFFSRPQRYDLRFRLDSAQRNIKFNVMIQIFLILTLLNAVRATKIARTATKQGQNH